MKKLLLFLLFLNFSCKNNDYKNSINKLQKNNYKEIKDKNSNEVYKINAKEITKDFKTWNNYNVYNIQLSQDFIALDIDSSKIDKLTFLKKLKLGNSIPLKIKMLQGQPTFKLFNSDSKDKDIQNAVIQIASLEIDHLNMEGKILPDFNFTDINGNNYNKTSTKGKLIVLKCWFVNCGVCVKEFPELNKLVEENKKIQNILFISLALDSKKDIQNFLKKKEFKYAVVPNAGNYITNKLDITMYPTHILINSKGEIIKVVNRIDDLIPFLIKEKLKM